MRLIRPLYAAAVLNMAHAESMKFRCSTKLKSRWVEACDEMRVSQNECFTALVELFLGQEQLVREAMVRRGSTVKIGIPAGRPKGK